jgi:exoribonuclease-2
MFAEKSLAVYKGKPALVMAVPHGGMGDKIEISLPDGEKLKVREKDIELIHPGPVSHMAEVVSLVSGAREDGTGGLSGDVRGAWELLQDTAVPLSEFAELVYGAYTPEAAWAAYALLREGRYFSGTIGAIRARDAASVAVDERKREEKQRETQGREAFLARLRAKVLDLPGDARFLQDVEALAAGSSGKSRTLKDLDQPETPEEAHRLLLAAGAWDEWINPHPPRFGLSAVSAREPLAPPPDEPRMDLGALRAYAIDNAYSADPDDAVSIEFSGETGTPILYVHVADPAASVLPESPADREARGRGATLYLPEGAARMLAPESLDHYALGLTDVSPALTFKMTLDEQGDIAETEIFPSRVRVTRLTYAEADAIIRGGDVLEGGHDGPRTPVPEARTLRQDLSALIAWSAANLRRRLDAGAVMIELPETHLSVDIAERRITIEESHSGPAAAMVRECMLLAGEGAARWASLRQLAFPFVSQETGDLPHSILPGMAGAYQLRRCMRPRSISVKPGLHWGLGLDQYSQVTSPLRRYLDLLAHQQIRAALGTPAYAGLPPRSAEEITLALGAGEAAYQASVHAERASRAHWTAVYLASRKDAGSPEGSSPSGNFWEGVVLEKKGGRATVIIPALGLETQVSLKSGAEPNDAVTLTLVSVKIPDGETIFAPV